MSRDQDIETIQEIAWRWDEESEDDADRAIAGCLFSLVGAAVLRDRRYARKFLIVCTGVAESRLDEELREVPS